MDGVVKLRRYSYMFVQRTRGPDTGWIETQTGLTINLNNSNGDLGVKKFVSLKLLVNER